MTEVFDRDEIVKRVGGALLRDVETAAQATSIAHDICVLLEVLGLRGDPEVDSLHGRWTLLVRTKFPDLVATRAGYLVRLARSDGQLSGEEVAKLISLATDLHVLGALGLGVPSELLTECAAALRERIIRQRQIKAIAVGLMRPWSRTLWCRELLLG